MTKAKYRTITKDGLFHIPDQYVTLADASKFLGVSRAKLEKFIQNDLLVWEQPKNRKERYVEKNGLARLKHPEIEPVFEPLKAKDARVLQKEIDTARHKISAAANLPPGAIKIYFDMGNE